MSPEARLLNAIDDLAAAIGDGAPGADEVSRLVGQIQALAAALELTDAVHAALQPEWQQTAKLPPETLAKLIDQLALAANTGLERRFSAAASLAGKEAPPREFADESREHLEAIERELLTLESHPGNPEPVHALFRGFHTIKGLAAIFNVPRVRDLAHEVESMLDRVRNGRLEVSPELIDLGLQCADALRSLLEGGETDSSVLLHRIRVICGAPAAGRTAAQQAAAPHKRDSHGRTHATVRVDTAKLDQLVDLVGELVIAQSLVESDPALRGAADPRLARNLAQLTRMTSQLQKAALGIRLVPLGPAFQRLSRAFRDLTRQAGKQAVLEIEGESIEVDRTILEQLGDPLMHMVRNAVDHGLEAPEARAAKGKPATGRVRLAASHRAGHIQIEISDDGQGLDHRKILDRAVERGLVQPDAQLTSAEILELIFEPGFSTAEKVTALSGRGVGMDVVRRQIEKLRGRVEIRSVAGEGTSFLLRLPLTLAIIDGLLVRVGEVRYLLPLFAVREMFRPKPGSVMTVEGRNEVVLLRDRAIPLVRLADLTGQQQARRDPYEGVLIVTYCNGHPCCLLVDQIDGKQEVVIKSLGGWFGHLRGISGGAILGDGSVGLILDLEGLLGGNVYGAAA